PGPDPGDPALRDVRGHVRSQSPLRAETSGAAHVVVADGRLHGRWHGVDSSDRQFRSVRDPSMGFDAGLAALVVFVLVVVVDAAAGDLRAGRDADDARRALDRLRGLSAPLVSADERPNWVAWVRALVSKLEKLASLLPDARVEELRKRLLHAGYFHANAP